MKNNHWVYNDGGRKAAGYKGDARDCVARSIAIATGYHYKAVCDALDKLAPLVELRGKARKKHSCSKTGVRRRVYERLLKELGWKWVATMGKGTGCKVHLKKEELPSGTLIVRVSGHLACVIDGVIHDTFDPSRNGTRCVYGYWFKP